MKLDPQYHQVKTNLPMSKSLPDVAEVYRHSYKKNVTKN